MTESHEWTPQLPVLNDPQLHKMAPHKSAMRGIQANNLFEGNKLITFCVSVPVEGSPYLNIQSSHGWDHGGAKYS